jgi:hypothetical protein
MKNELLSDTGFSIGNTVIKLAFVGGILLFCMYGILLAFAGAIKVLE